MRLPRGTPLHLIFFVVGILVPTLVLSIFSFRSIRNEVLLAEKNYEEEQSSFRKVMQETMQKETMRTLQDVRRKSQYLFDRPHSIEELSKPFTLEQVEGVSALFLFTGDQLVFPSLQFKSRNHELPLSVPTHQDKRLFAKETRTSSLGPDAATPTTLLLSQLRTHYRNRNFLAAFRVLDQLERLPNPQGYLLGPLAESISLMRFHLLAESGNYIEAEQYCLHLLTVFLNSPVSPDLAQSRYAFESMFNAILSFERLDNKSREQFWNLRHNINSQLEHIAIYGEHRTFFQRVQNDPLATTGSGVDFQQNNNSWFFILSHPWLPGNQMVIGLLDTNAFAQRLQKQIQMAAREWKHVRFAIYNTTDSLIAGQRPGHGSVVIASIPLAEQYPQWTLNLYQKDNGEFRRESRNKIILLYTLVGFSLLIILLGSIFVYQGLTQERRLLAMKANFLSSVSHELKTPLTSIKMFADMIAGGRVQKHEKVMEYSALIGKEATRLENLIGAILSYTRMEHGSTAFKWECIDLSALAEKVFNAVESIGMSRGLELNGHWEKSCWVMGDYTSLYSLVQNLTDNAIKYTPPPGTIDVSVTRDGEYVLFTVVDTGVGISPSEQKNIFKDFYRVGDEMTRSTKGSGLGLAIVKRVADAHRAPILVHSRPGKGSTFTVRFKRAENAAQNSGG
jgi:signal transduction histidine kinase